MLRVINLSNNNKLVREKHNQVDILFDI